MGVHVWSSPTIFRIHHSFSVTSPYPDPDVGSRLYSDENKLTYFNHCIHCIQRTNSVALSKDSDSESRIVFWRTRQNPPDTLKSLMVNSYYSHKVSTGNQSHYQTSIYLHGPSNLSLDSSVLIVPPLFTEVTHSIVPLELWYTVKWNKIFKNVLTSCATWADCCGNHKGELVNES